MNDNDENESDRIFDEIFGPEAVRSISDFDEAHERAREEDGIDYHCSTIRQLEELRFENSLRVRSREMYEIICDLSMLPLTYLDVDGKIRTPRSVADEWDRLIRAARSMVRRINGTL